MTLQHKFIERLVEVNGVKGIFLIDTEYPYGNIQVIPMKEEYRERVLTQLRSNHRWPFEVKGRTDFITVSMGSPVKLDYGDSVCTWAVSNAIKDATRAAAEWWNLNHPSPVDYAGLDLPEANEEILKEHPTFQGNQPVAIPADYLAQWKEDNKHLIATLENCKENR